MSPVAPEMHVFSIDDRRVGTVGNVLSFCFEVRCREGGGTKLIRHECVFHADTGRVTLIVQPTELERYSCPIHELTRPGGAH